MRRVALALCIFLSPAIGHASSSCPWVNAATAFGALGTTPEAAGTNASTTSTSCAFTTRTPNALRELRVTVEQPPDAPGNFASRKAACGPNAQPISTIGNEAVACSMATNGNLYGQQIIGRVRDQVFTVQITATTPKTFAAVNELRLKAEMLAEIVSGNIF